MSREDSSGWDTQNPHSLHHLLTLPFTSSDPTVPSRHPSGRRGSEPEKRDERLIPGVSEQKGPPPRGSHLSYKGVGEGTTEGEKDPSKMTVCDGLWIPLLVRTYPLKGLDGGFLEFKSRIVENEWGREEDSILDFRSHL